MSGAWLASAPLWPSLWNRAAKEAAESGWGPQDKAAEQPPGAGAEEEDAAAEEEAAARPEPWAAGEPGTPAAATSAGPRKEPTCQCRRHERHGFDPWVIRLERGPGIALQATTSPPALGGQTQTQLEHARIGELEQNLLLEKAQAERLLRELADNRVTAAASASARQRPCQRPRFIIFSLSGPRNLDSSLCFFQPSVSHDVLCI